MNVLLILGIIGILGLVAAFFYAKALVKFIINSLIGIFALMGWNALFTPVVINVWSVLLVAIFGVVGLFIVVGLHVLGWLF